MEGTSRDPPAGIDGLTARSALACTYCYDAVGFLLRLTSAEHQQWRFWHGRRVVNDVRTSTAGTAQMTWLHAAGAVTAEILSGHDARSSLLASSIGGSLLLEVDDEVRPVHFSPHGHRGNGALAEVGFNGEMLDPASGCYLLGGGHHRPYSPVLALFLAPDRASPFGRGGLNSLSYCAGDPVNRTDPTGHFWKWIIAGVTLAFSAVAVGLSAGAALPALIGSAAMTKTAMAATASMTLGVAGVGLEAAALTVKDEGVATVLGLVGMGLGAIGAAGAVGGAIKAAAKGAAKAVAKSTGTLAAKQASFSKRASTLMDDIIGLPQGGHQRSTVNVLWETVEDMPTAVNAVRRGGSPSLYASAASKLAAQKRGYPLMSELSDVGRANALTRARERIAGKGLSRDLFQFHRDEGLFSWASDSYISWNPHPVSVRGAPDTLPDLVRVADDGLPPYPFSEAQWRRNPYTIRYSQEVPAGHAPPAYPATTDL